MADITRKITARLPGKCPACREAIAVGETIARKERQGGGWSGRWHHSRCLVTWLVDGRMIPGTQGVALRIAMNADGERVGSNAETVLGGMAEYAPDAAVRAGAIVGEAQARDAGMIR